MVLFIIILRTTPPLSNFFPFSSAQTSPFAFLSFSLHTPPRLISFLFFSAQTSPYAIISFSLQIPGSFLFGAADHVFVQF